MRWILLAILALSSCAPYHEFTPSSTQHFDARPADYPIAYFPAPPKDRAYIVLGQVEGKAGTLNQMLKYFKELAREVGGDAIIGMDSQQVVTFVQMYRAIIIRYE